MSNIDRPRPTQFSSLKVGAIVGIVTAIIGILSAFLTLYSQASDVIDKAVGIRLRQDFAPVGTIVASYLDEAEFASAIGEDISWGFDKRKWILADGSTVRDTEFARITSNKPVPDLRGIFLRGVADGREVGSKEEYSTALPTIPFAGMTDEAGTHNHVGGMALNTRGEKYNAGGRDYQVAGAASTGNSGAHRHNVAIIEGGDSETRPTNVAVFYYIKIN
jgi:hypothetical protein